MPTRLADGFGRKELAYSVCGDSPQSLVPPPAFRAFGSYGLAVTLSEGVLGVKSSRFSHIVRLPQSNLGVFYDLVMVAALCSQQAKRRGHPRDGVESNVYIPHGSKTG